MKWRFPNPVTRLVQLAAILALSVTSVSCVRAVPPSKPPSEPPASLSPAQPRVQVPAGKEAETYSETGTASWYGKDFHGRKTASGETFDMYGISAAHRTLPLGTYIRVTNLDNYKSLKVKVNDRGPFVRNRILELSYGAAKELGFVAQGTAPVKIETLDAVPQSGPFTVQAGSFVEEANAKALRERLSGKFEFVYIVPFESNIAKFYQVRVGSYATEEKAEHVAAKLTLDGLEPTVLRKD